MKDYKALIQQYELDVYPRRDVVLVKGKDSRVWDDQGKEYIDLASGISVANVGHCNEKVVEAISKQAGTLITCANTFYNDAKAIFLEKLFSVAPKNLTRAFLTNSGTEAVEAAIKFARSNTKKTKFISAMKGFHGRTYGSLSLTDSKKIHKDKFEPFLPVKHVTYAYPYRFNGNKQECINHSLNELEKAINELQNDVAAIFMEPIQGEGGYIVPPIEFVKGVREICFKYGILQNFINAKYKF